MADSPDLGNTVGVGNRMAMMNRFEARAYVRDAAHSIVYRNDREFCGWPFICGFWTTAAGHHLVAFQKKPCAYAAPGDVHHDEVAKVGPKIVTVATPRAAAMCRGPVSLLTIRSSRDTTALSVAKSTWSEGNVTAG